MLEMKMSLFFLLLPILSLASEPATSMAKSEPKLEVIFLCGKDRAKGFLASEWAYLDEAEGMSRLYHQGKQLKEDDFDVASGENAWIVTLPGKEERKLVVNTKNKRAQLYLLEAKGKSKKIGSHFFCTIP